jgi:hypothetical protein
MIYYIASKARISSSIKFSGPVIHSEDQLLQLDNDGLVELDDPAQICVTNRWFEINGVAYQLLLTGPAYRYSHAEEGNISLVDESGEKLDVSPEISHLLVGALPNKILGNQVVGQIRDYKGIRGDHLFLANVDTDELVYREDTSLQKTLLREDGIYGYHFGNKNYVKLDHQLNTLWVFDQNPKCKRPKEAIPYKDMILFYAGCSDIESLEEVEEVPGAEGLSYGHGILRGGELYCLDRETGEKQWNRTFSDALNDLVLHEGKVYCAGNRDLYRISAESGEIEHSVKMEFSAGGETVPYNVLQVIDNKLWITINYWFEKSFCLLVVNLETLETDHKIDLPDPYVPDRFLYFDEQTRRAFYRLRPHYGSPYQEHREPLLVLDMGDLEQPVVFEDKPDIEAELKPAMDDSSQEELWVYLKGAPLHQALRFGIVETQNQVSSIASVPNRRNKKRETFNGRAHFRYSGSDRTKKEIEEMLKAVESSFNKWAEMMSVKAGNDSGGRVSIDVAYEK